MKFVKTEMTIKSKKALRKDLQAFIWKFYESDLEIAKVEYTKEEYQNVKTCYSSMRSAARKSNLPVKVVMKNGEVYLYKVKGA